MNEGTQHHRSYLFTVRMWLEDLGDGQAEWRGKAESIANGEICYFREWPALLAFLEKQTKDTGNYLGQEPGGKERIG